MKSVGIFLVLVVLWQCWAPGNTQGAVGDCSCTTQPFITVCVCDTLNRLSFRRLNQSPVLLLRCTDSFTSSSIARDAFRENSGIVSLVIFGCRLNRVTSNTFNGLISLRNITLNFVPATIFDEGWMNNMGSLKHLDLEFNGFTLLTPDFFSGARNVEVLLVSNNALTTISRLMFGHLTSLTILLLNNNRITRIDELAFSRQTHTLKALYLGDNPLRRTPRALAILPALLILDLRDTGLRRIDSAILARLPRLAELHLHENAITSCPAGAFRGNRRLRYLDVCHNSIVSVDRCFTGLTILERLFLENNRLRVIRQNVLPRSLISVNMSGNSISSVDRHAFNGLDRLVVVDLTFNLLTNFAPTFLVFTTRAPRLIFLVNGNQLRCVCTDLFEGGLACRGGAVISETRGPQRFDRYIRRSTVTCF